MATQLGQILDADIYFNPSDSNTAYATPQALAANPKAYDLESLLTHEFGHFLGFSHSAVWSAIMFPFAPAPGTFSGLRPTTQQPDAPLPLGDDDRTGLRVLYPDSADTAHQGSISGRISPANPLALPASPVGVTGVFCAQVVAVDAASGAAAGAVIGGWSCAAPGPAQFDGTYQIDGLAVGHSYTVYAEALNGAVDPSQFDNAIVALCRNVVYRRGLAAAAWMRGSRSGYELYGSDSARTLKRISSFHFLFAIFVKCEPAAAEQKTRAKRSKEDGAAMLARLLHSTPQDFMQGCAAGG